jgi:tetratricopeptide (TPR) repeat protein
VLETRADLLGENHPLAHRARRSLGDLLFAQGRIDEAAIHYREAKEDRPARRGSALARFMQMQGHGEEAEAHVRSHLAQSRASRGDDHIATLRLLTQLGVMLHQQGRLDEAETLLKEATESARRRPGRNPELADMLTSYGVLLIELARLEEADAVLRDALDRQIALRGAEHPSALATTVVMGSLHEAAQRPQEAIALLAPAEAAARAQAGSTPRSAPTLATLLGLLGSARASLDQFVEAQRNLLEAYDILAGEGAGGWTSAVADGGGATKTGSGTATGAGAGSAGDPERDPHDGPNSITTAQPAPPEPPSSDLQEMALRLATLYHRWHTAVPGAGHDGEAAKWDRRATGRE